MCLSPNEVLPAISLPSRRLDKSHHIRGSFFNNFCSWAVIWRSWLFLFFWGHLFCLGNFSFANELKSVSCFLIIIFIWATPFLIRFHLLYIVKNGYISWEKGTFLIFARLGFGVVLCRFKLNLIWLGVLLHFFTLVRSVTAQHSSREKFNIRVEQVLQVADHFLPMTWKFLRFFGFGLDLDFLRIYRNYFWLRHPIIWIT